MNRKADKQVDYQITKKRFTYKTSIILLTSTILENEAIMYGLKSWSIQTCQ